MRAQCLRFLPFGLLFTPMSAFGQAPIVTPAGDPSVRDDSIYALVVDASDHPEDGAIRLFDDGIVQVRDDGSFSQTYRTVLQILKPQAIAPWSEFNWQIDPANERFRLNWVRVLRPDGTLVAAEPLHYQESDVPVGGPGPIYTDMKQITFSLSGVEPGSIIDYSFTIEVFEPVLAGDLLLSWGITTGTPVRRSRYVLEAPRDFGLRVRAHNLPSPAFLSEDGASVTQSYVYADLPTIEPELFPADSGAPYASLLITGPVGWSDIAAWYADLARGRYTLGHAAAHAVDSIVAAVPVDDRMQALHRWIAQDIRYVSLSLGIGGYQPRTPDETYRTRAGDCKDKATLFVAAARRLGYEAYPVLVSSIGGIRVAHPSLEQFDHAIAAFRNPGGEWRYVDLTADIVPHGQLPAGLQGSFGLLVHDDGSAEEVQLPADPLVRNYKYLELVGELLPDGRFAGRFNQHATGHPEHALRQSLADPIDESQRGQVANGIARSLFPAAVGDSLELFVGLDWSDSAAISLRLSAADFVQDLGGGRYLLTLPIQQYGEAVKPLIAQLDEDSLRTFGISAEQVSGSAVVEQVVSLTLPDGWVTDLPDDVHATSDFGAYSATYAQNGRVLRVSRTLTGSRGVYGPERVADLRAWLSEVAEDDVRFVLIEAN